jgi:UDP-GlcNAc:undecaprenyl-phosphate GlcNAc-1-phosphate transferase
LGDSGSLLLGFILAVISIQGSSKGPALVGLLAPILALGFPIMETLLSMIRRFLRSIRIIDDPTRNGRFRTVPVSKPSIFRADKDHFHHRLLKFGYSQKKAVILLYAICIALSVLAFLVVAIEDLNLTAALAAIIIVFFIGIKRLKYDEFRILENGLLIPLFSYPIINKSLFQVFIDLGMISFSFYLSFLLLFRGFDGPVRELFVRSLSIVLLVKIVVFHFSGLYKRSWVYSRLEDALAVLKATFLSSLISVVVLAFIFKLESFGGIVLFVLDFYLLLTGVAGLRISHHVFISYYRRSAAQRGKKVLIYGAGGRGSTVLREIRKNGNYTFSPAGFMDDSPEKKGIQMQGVPVLGSIEDLDEIFRENNISEIIVSTTKIGRDKIKRLTEFGKQKGIVIRQYEYRFYEFS